MFKSLLLPRFDADTGASGGAPEGSPGDSNSQATASPTPTPAFEGTPQWGLPANQAPNAVNPLAPVTPPPTEFLDFSGRKVPVVDPILKDIHKDYSTLNSTFTKTSQELAEMRGRAQVLEQMVQQYQQQPSAQPQAPQPPSAEELEAAKEQFMNRFYDDPLGAIEELVTSKVNPAIEPITKEREWNQQVQTMQQKYTDFADVVPQMQELLQTQPHLASQGLETVYFVAKGRSAQQSSTPQLTPEQLINDPQFVQQYVLSNPQISQQVVSQYLQQRQSTNAQTPVVIGNQPGGSPPAMPEVKPTTLSEGSKAFARYLGL